MPGYEARGQWPGYELGKASEGGLGMRLEVSGLGMS